ncbi:MAG: hypothetical protein JWO52_1379, partial [Gammaproteobacteria bacterium]|nr:hypothetical protein [Gammaproteobacteria bacterium]
MPHATAQVASEHIDVTWVSCHFGAQCAEVAGAPLLLLCHKSKRSLHYLEKQRSRDLSVGTPDTRQLCDDAHPNDDLGWQTRASRRCV